MSDTLPDPTATFPPAADTVPPTAGGPAATPRAPADRYDLTGEIGHGGMGAVLRARDRLLHRDLALKVMLDHHQANPTLRRRFVEEAQVGGQLQHPGVVPVYDLGELPDGRPFFSMKLVKGQTLAELLAERPEPAHDLPRFVQVFEQVCQTVAYAHAKGVVHRDLKPANVMVGAFGEVQVMDWGLAKVLDSASRERQRPEGQAASVVETGRSRDADSGTQAGSALGTFAYMPPEQAAGQTGQLDRRADVFGLGAVLCEILTGQPPYVGPTAEAVKLQAVLGDLNGAAGRLGRCGADAELVELATRCLAGRPDDRPADAAAVAGAVTAYRAGVEGRLHRAELERAAAQARAEGERRRRRLTAALALAGLLLLALGGGGAWWAWQDRADRAAQVDAALTEAKGLQKRAEVLENDPIQRADTLALAQAAAGRAVDRLGWGLGAERAEEARQLNAKLTEQAREARVLADLEAARLEQAEVSGLSFDPQKAVPYYESVFRRYRLDPPAAEPAAVARAVTEQPARVRAALVAALDAWADLAGPGPVQDRLREAVRLAEPPESLAGRLAAAVARSDRPAVRGLVRAAGPGELPPATAVALSRRLEDAEAFELLQAAFRRAPNDFWVNFTLGIRLRDGHPPQPDRAVRHLTAARALRPRNPVVSTQLGFALLRHGLTEEAKDAFNASIELNVDCIHAHYGMGQALLDEGLCDEAAAAYRKAIARYPGRADLRYQLGIALDGAGRPAEAATELRRWRDGLPADHPGWARADARLRAAEHSAALAEKLPAVLRGEAGPADAAEQLGLARLCAKSYQGRNATAARFYAAAFAADPKLAAADRYAAARAAALAAAGKGTDATGLPAKARAGLRRQALDWLRAALAARPTPEALRHWQADGDLAGVRDPAALAALPEAERVAWAKLWSDVQALLATPAGPG